MKKLILIIFILLSCAIIANVEDDENELVKAVKVIRKPNAGFMTMEIYYDNEGKLVKEILKGETQEVLQILEFKQYNVKNKPKKAEIIDFNGIRIGFFDLIYDIEGKLMKAIQKDLNGNIVRTSYVTEENDVYKELIADKTQKIIKEKKYGFGEVIQIISDKTDDIVKIKKISRNGEEFTQKIYYDLSMRPKQEIMYDKNNRMVSKYVYNEYFDNGRPKKAELYDINGVLKGYMFFNYDNFGNIEEAVQVNLKGEIIKYSELQKGYNRYVESWKNNNRELISKTDYYIDDKKIEIVDKKEKEYYQNQENYNSMINKTEKEYLRQEKLSSVPTEDKWKEYNLDYYLDIKDKEESERIKNYDKSPFLREYDKKLSEKIQNIYSKKLREKIAFSEQDYYITRVNTEDTVIGQIVTDGIKYFSETDIVLFDSESFKTGIEAGEVYFKDIFNMFDKEDKIYFTELYGTEIKALLTSASNFGDKGHINTAGLYWENNGEGKIENIKVKGQALIPNKKYSVTVNENIAKRKNFYSVIPISVQFYRTKYPVFMIVADYIESLKVLDKSYILEKRHIKPKFDK